MVSSKAHRKTISLADQAHSTLEELIITLKLPPGSTWTEVQLCEMIGVGRTPVHEAVQRLASDHLISVMRRHGIVISKVNVQEQLLVLEVRRGLERLIAVKAARRISENEKKELLALAKSMEEACEQGDAQLFLRRNTILKKYMANCSQNPFAAKALAPLMTLSWRFYYIYHKHLNDLPKVAGLHSAVVKAIIVGNEQLAAQASDAALDYTEQFTRDIFING